MRNDAVQRALWSKGWCKACIARIYCGAEHTECHPSRHYPNEVLRPDHPDLLHWVAREARGLQFDEVAGRRIDAPPLPAYIPQVERGLDIAATGLPFVALTLKDIFSSKELRPITKGDIRDKLGLHQAAKVILLGIGKDELIERIWGQQTRIYETIKALNFDLVTGFNYSIWHIEPRLEHLVNLKRSLLTFERLQAVGVPVIPHVYWYNSTDLSRWADWLRRNDLRMIAINLQTAKKRAMWERLLEGIEWMGRSFPKELEYLVIGPSTYERISAVRDRLGRVTFSNKDAYMLATGHYYKTWTGKEFGKVHWDARPSIIFHHNVALITRVTQGSPPAPIALLHGPRLAVAEQRTLPGISTDPSHQLEQLRLVGS